MVDTPGERWALCCHDAAPLSDDWVRPATRVLQRSVTLRSVTIRSFVNQHALVYATHAVVRLICQLFLSYLIIDILATYVHTDVHPIVDTLLTSRFVTALKN